MTSTTTNTNNGIERDPGTSRMFQASGENIPKDSIDCGIVACGSCNGPGCQRLATKRTFLIIFSIVGILLGGAESYLRISIKQAALSHDYDDKIIDWLLVCHGLAQILLAIVLTHWAVKIHRIAWLGGLVMAQAIFCFVMVIPSLTHIALEFIPLNQAPNLCNAANYTTPLKFKMPAEDTFITLILLFVAQIGISLGNIAFYALGLSYIDDNVENRDSPALIGTALAAKFYGFQLGPAISLTVSAISFDWWLGWTVLSPLTFIFAVLVSMFPRKLVTTVVKQAARRILEDSYSQLDQFFSRQNYLQNVHLFPSLRRLISNKIFIFNVIAFAFIQTAAINYVANEENYLQSRFLLPTSDADGLLNEWTSRIISFMLKPPLLGVTILLAGLIIARVNPHGRSLAMWNIIMGFLTVLLFISYIFIECKGSRLAGVFNGKLLQPGCSSNCQCPQSIQFSPVCPEDSLRTYFSPCHAGCRKQTSLNNLVIYENCDCGVDSELSISGGKATQGACSFNECQHKWIIYQALTILGGVFFASTIVGKVLITLRSVLPQDKALALAFDLTFVGLFTYIPGKIGYDQVSENTCHYTSQDRQICYLHDSPTYGNILNIISACLVALSILFDILVYIFAKDLKCFDDGDDDSGKYRPIPLKNMSRNANGNNNNTYRSLNDTLDDSETDRQPAVLTESPQRIRTIQNTQKDFGSRSISPPSIPRSSPSIVYAEVVHDFKTQLDKLDFRMQLPETPDETAKLSTERDDDVPSTSKMTADPSRTLERNILNNEIRDILQNRTRIRNDRTTSPETDF